MTLTTLDKIVRSALSDRGYTMHWYLQFLTYAVNGLRELNFDVMQNIKSVRLPVNSYKAATLPIDYVDYVRVGNEVGQYILPWSEKQDSFNRLNKFDSQGNKISYGDVEATNGILPNNWEGFWFIPWFFSQRTVLNLKQLYVSLVLRFSRYCFIPPTLRSSDCLVRRRVTFV